MITIYNECMSRTARPEKCPFGMTIRSLCLFGASSSSTFSTEWAQQLSKDTSRLGFFTLLMSAGLYGRYRVSQCQSRTDARVTSNPSSLSPCSPYPLPYHHGRSKFHSLSCLDGRDGDPFMAVADEFLPSPSSRHQRYSVPNVVYNHSSCYYQDLYQCDRLERAHGTPVHPR